MITSSDFKKQNDSLREHIAQLQELYNLTEVIHKSSDKIETIYKIILNSIKKLLKAKKAAILLFDNTGNLTFKSYIGLSKKYREKVADHKTWTPNIKNPKVSFVENVKKDLSISSSKRTLLNEGIQALGFFPLISQKNLIGKLMIYYPIPHQFSKEEIQLVQIICNQITSTVRRFETSKLILDSLADGITVQDPQGKVVFANEAAAKSSGYDSVEQMLKNSHKILTEFEIRNDAGEVFDLSRLPGRRVLNGEESAEDLLQYRNLKSKERKWVIVKARPILDEEGKIKMITNIMHDVTDRLELEKRKDEFISAASHELKTPLAILKGFAQIMEGERDYNKNRYYLNKMVDQINRLTKLVEDLLDVSRIQADKLELKKEKINIVELIEDTTKNLQLIDGGHEIILKNGVIKKEVKADKYRISEVLNNLISNAVKFSPNQDKVIVSIKNKQKDLIVSIKDFGIGISKRDLKRIFQPFFQADSRIRPSFGGLGLGLHISSKIITHHGGRIWVRSKKGSGSIFSFSLPLI